jgi:hypothetical protein
MRESFPADAELTAFFGSEPAVLESGIPWEYNTLTFSVERAGDQVTCVIVPALIVIELTWSRDGEEVFRFAAAEIARVDIVSENGARALAASTPGGSLALRLRLEPRVRVHVGNGFRG